MIDAWHGGQHWSDAVVHLASESSAFLLAGRDHPSAGRRRGYGRWPSACGDRFRVFGPTTGFDKSTVHTARSFPRPLTVSRATETDSAPGNVSVSWQCAEQRVSDPASQQVTADRSGRRHGCAATFAGTPQREVVPRT